MNLVCSKGYFLRLTQLNTFVRYTTSASLSSEIIPPPHSNVFLWNSVFKSCLENKNSRWVLVLFPQMLQSNVKPNHLTFSLLIKACTSLLDSLYVKQEAKQIHSYIIRSGFDRFAYVGTALIDLYAKSGCILLADQLFEEMPDRDIVTWNSLICGYSYNGYDFDALGLFSEMLNQGMSPCRVTLVGVIPSCARPDLLFPGKSIHGFGIKVALDLDSRVKNALTAMYSKCSDLDAVRLLFKEMSEKSIISWNIMIGAYGQNGYVDEALLIFKQMLDENVGANSVTIVSLLSVNVPLDSIHSYALKIGLDTDNSVITSLVCMYARRGSTKLAGLLYGSMPHKNLVSLTAIISSYVEKGEMAYALEWFAQMHLVNLKPDAVAMVSVLHGFTNPIYIGAGTALHGYSIKSGLDSDTLVSNGLISMYAKFDDMEASFSLFLSMLDRPLISWNTMISSCVHSGRTSDAMELFFQMKMFGCIPDPITMASIISGCSQIGSLHFGRRVHNYILRNNLEVEDFVGTALIDMYAKCGSISSAERVFKSIKEPCLATWNTMISGYGLYGLECEALWLYSEMVKKGLQPDEFTFLGVLSACNHSGLVEEGQRYFKAMKEEFGIVPGLQHCACMVDLLSRAGLLDEAVTFINNMEFKPDSVVWGTLLGSCCVHQEIKLGECLAKRVFLLDHQNGGFYLLMSNLYASIGMWDDVARVREMMRNIGEDGCSGTSIIESSCSDFFLQEMNSSE